MGKSRLYSLKRGDVFAWYPPNPNYKENKGKKNVSQSNINRVVKLYEAYVGDGDFEKLIQENRARLITLGYVAVDAGERNLGLEILSRSMNKAHYKYVFWRDSGRPLSRLVDELDNREIRTVTGIFVNLGEYESANVLRREAREIERKEYQDFSCAAELSFKMSDWPGLIEDVRNSYGEGVFYDVDPLDLLKYARVSKRQSPEVSRELYSILKERLKEKRDWIFLAMACSESGEKERAVKYYERARCFVPAWNFRRNLGWPTDACSRNIVKQAFYQDRINSDTHHVAFDDPSAEDMEKSVKAARRFGLEGMLEGMLASHFHYKTIVELASSLGVDAATYERLIGDITRASEIVNGDKWHAFEVNEKDGMGIANAVRDDLGAEQMREFINDLSPQNFLRVLGVDERVIDRLVLGFSGLYGMSFPGSMERDSGCYGMVVHPFVLDSIQGMFDAGNYAVLLESAPIISNFEFDEGEDFSSKAESLIWTAGNRMRRAYRKYGVKMNNCFDSPLLRRACIRMGV